MRLLMILGWWLRSAFMAGCLWLAGGALALTIPATPLGAGQVVEPNVLYLLDDSGSMMWDIMPDEGVTNSYHGWLFPLPDDTYGASLYYTTPDLSTAYSSKNDFYQIYMALPSFADNNIYSIYLRSSRNNSVYYDPARTYRPWLDSNGLPFGVDAPLQNANPRKAYWNPANKGSGSINLTVSNTSTDAGQPAVHWFSSTASDYRQAAASRSVSQLTGVRYHPMTFYVYDAGPSGNPHLASSYTRYQMRGNILYKRKLPNGTEINAGAELSWADGKVSRTIAEEQVNFANWFQYYRSRFLAFKAASSHAFADLGTAYRIGLASINLRGTSSDEFLVPQSGDFSGTNRQTFFDRLLALPISLNGTPLRGALRWAGDKYQSEYWKDNIECRRAFALMTTDGSWNAEADLSVGNVDENEGRPYADTVADTLADVAMHYWKTDLSALANLVPAKESNPQTQQHMTTIGLTLGKHGLLDPKTDLPALKSGALAWPDPFGSGAAKIDDLWHATINSRGSFISAEDPEQLRLGLVDAFKDIDNSVSSHSAGAVSGAAYTAASLYFQAQFSANGWYGQLDAYGLARLGKGYFIVNPPKWRASERLALNGNRQIFTSTLNGASTLPFTVAGLGVVNMAVNGLNPSMVDYLRGGRSNESPAGLKYRKRSELLGDIIDSSPLYVGRPSDKLPLHQLRPPMVYVAANDGMLHAFDVATGDERFAYIPSPALGRLASLADTDYGAKHQYLMDGQLSTAEAQIGSEYRTLLAGSQGRGGESLFLLDVTAPQNIQESTLPNARPLLWEFSNLNDPYLGKLYQSAPRIARLNDGKDYVLAPNGYNSLLGGAHLFVLPVSNPTHAWLPGFNYWRLSASLLSGNGLSAITPYDMDANGTVDLVYAGDLKGNLWKFDLSSKDPLYWKVGLAGQPLYKALGPKNLPQPIVSAPVLAPHPDGKPVPVTATRPGVMVYVGTGRFLDACDQAGTQCVGEDSVDSIYGIWDYGGQVCQRKELQQQQLVNASIANTTTGTFRKVTKRALVYPPQTIYATPCMTGVTPRSLVAGPGGTYAFPAFGLPQTERVKNSSYWLGWFIDLPAEGERVVGHLRYDRRRLEVQTYIPSAVGSKACGAANDASYILRLNYQNGGPFTRPRFLHSQLDAALARKQADAFDVVGLRLQGALGRTAISNSTLLANTNGGTGGPVIEPGGRTVRRVSWREIISDCPISFTSTGGISCTGK